MIPADLYPWLKGLHVAAAMLFVGGVLAATVFLSTLRSQAQLTDVQRTSIAVARRWDRGLTTPAMLTVWTLGLLLAVSGGWFRSGWLPLKLVFVLVLSGVHGMQSGALRRLAGDAARPKSQQALFIIVASCAVLIAVLAVVKPF